MTEEQIRDCAEEIAIRARVQRNVPYSYDGHDYLSCDEMIAAVIRKHLKK